MTKPGTVDDWAVVETAQEFRIYLARLSYDFQRAPDGWRNRELPEFFDAWARWLCGRYLRPGGSPRDEIDPPTWQGFARQMFYARTSDNPPVSAALPRPDDHNVVDSLEAFAGFLLWLADDFRRDAAELAQRARDGLWAAEGDWRSADIASYLEMWIIWSAEAFDPDPVSLRAPVSGEGHGLSYGPLTWGSCAGQLYAARIYE
jgi:hypothetical protein